MSGWRMLGWLDTQRTQVLPVSTGTAHETQYITQPCAEAGSLKVRTDYICTVGSSVRIPGQFDVISNDGQTESFIGDPVSYARGVDMLNTIDAHLNATHSGIGNYLDGKTYDASQSLKAANRYVAGNGLETASP